MFTQRIEQRCADIELQVMLATVNVQAHRNRLVRIEPVRGFGGHRRVGEQRRRSSGYSAR
jgi:hypothetical protein